ncbi:MAG: hypothetical protein L7H18_01685 [Candidatus Nealsonbacteria bacterium DGGOD1a]|jgi:hypothetical protein|nr:MAG: hypothetical protein L7H18_01685 [Candidatus Nealsonbacteria bacterium DGGOD1a]
MTRQEMFLSEHNKLSPLNLRATIALLVRFKEEKPSLFEDGEDWPLDKLRRPFIMWLTSLPIRNRKS